MSLSDTSIANALSRQVINTCHAVENAGWHFQLQYVLSHVAVVETEVVDLVARGVHNND